MKRRALLVGIAAALAAPAVVRAESLMKIAALRSDVASLNEATLLLEAMERIELLEPLPVNFSSLVGFRIFHRDGAIFKLPIYAEDFYGP